MNKIIFSKAHEQNFYAVLFLIKKSKIEIGKELINKDIESFIIELAELAKNEDVHIIEYDCSIYLDECRDLRIKLYDSNVTVRGYIPTKPLRERIIPQVSWIENNIIVSDNIKGELESYYPDSEDCNIVVDLMADSAKYLRRIYKSK